MISSIRLIYAVSVVVVFYGNIHNYLHYHHNIGVPWHWVLALIVLSLPLIFQQALTTDLVRHPIVVWCLGYVLITMIWFIGGPQSEMAWQEVRWRFLAVVEIISFLCIFMDAKANVFSRWALVVSIHGAVAVNIYELFMPMSFSEVVGRSAGLYISPNIAAEALVLGMILAITILPEWYRGYFLLLTGIGVFVTFSRSGLIGWCIASVGLMLGRFVRGNELLRTGSISLILVGLVLLPKANEIATALERTGSLNANVLERLSWLIDPSGVSDASSWSRKLIAQQAWDRVAERPFWGGGTGAVHDGLFILPHNQFLAYMMDHGFLGAMILPLLFLAIVWWSVGDYRRLGLIYCCSVLWFSFFTHTLLNNSHSLLLVALMAVLGSTHVQEFANRGYLPSNPCVKKALSTV